MTLEEQIRQFEEKWNVTTKIFSNEDVSAEAYMWGNIYPLGNPLFTARFKNKSYFYARYNQKRTTYPIQESLFDKRFIKEFKTLATRVRKERIDDTK